MFKKENRLYLNIIIALCGLICGSIGVCNNTVGLFYNIVSEDLHVLTGTFILHNTLSSLMLAVVATFVPKYLTSNNFRLFISSGVILTSLSAIVMGFSHNLYLFYLLGTLRGTGCAFFGFVVVSIIINQWFASGHGVITSIVFAFSGVAGAVLSPVYSFIIEHFGWSIGYIAQGITIFVLALPFMLSKWTYKPEDMNMKAYGEKEILTDHKASVSLKTPVFYYICISFFAATIHLNGTLMQQLSNFTIEKGYAISIGAMVLSFSMIGNILSKFLCGTVSDRIGPVLANQVFLLIVILSASLLVLAGNPVSLYVGGLFFGSIYSLTAVGLVLITEYFFGKEKYNTVYPVMALVGNLCTALGSVLVGYSFDFLHSYKPAFILGIIFMIINMVLIFLCSQMHKKVSKNI